VSPDTAGGEGPHQPAVLERAHANHVEAYRALARAIPKARIEEDSDAVYIRTELPAPDFNSVFVDHRPGNLDQIIDRARRFFDGWRGPRRIISTPEAAEAVRPAAGHLHLALGEGVPLMILDPLDRPATPLPEGLSLDRVEDEETLRTYFMTGALGYGAPREAFASLTENKDALARVLGTPDWTNYLASIGGLPVATVLRFTSHRVAGIYFVSTLPEYRRRGIGGAITLRAALEGNREGCTISGLQSSSMGFPVYRRIGYRHAFSYVQWVSGGVRS